ncbi:protein takeout-like [Chironomus tepperi]|uniref:protein takeout-like n=1 Tax=Chironomus tepperi TaxID=113505 RepID=UPI00391F0035
MSQKIGLSQIDPLRIKKMDIEQGGNASVAINLKFRNVDLIGLAKAEVYKVTGFKEDPDKNKLEIKFKVPLGTIQGPYQISGKILVLPIQGKGNVTLNLENLDITLKFLTTKVERDGKTYMNIERSKFSYTVSGANVNFSNLFNGDKALGDNMNSFLNINWSILLDELKKPITTSFADVFKNLLNDLFQKTPYDEFFEK